MAVEALVCDSSGTLVDGEWAPQPGVVDMLRRLRAIGVRIIIASNQSEMATRQQLGDLANLVDQLICHEHVRANKGSDKWTTAISDRTGLAPNQLFYVGNTVWDMITATRGPIVYAHAGWSGKTSTGYGLLAPAPGWVAAVIEHIFRKSHLWYWSLNRNDGGGNPVNTVSLLDANGAGGDEALRRALLGLFKDNRDAHLGPMTLKEFVMLQMLASLNADGDFASAQFWTTYPGHDGALNAAMRDFLDIAAKLGRNKYKDDLLVRHSRAENSNTVFHRAGGGMPGAIAAAGNQLATMKVGDNYRAKLTDKNILLLDNFLTWGSTTESGRNLLLSAGAKTVKVACVGKYGERMYTMGTPAIKWDPFGTSHARAASFTYDERSGVRDLDALLEFAASHAAMRNEAW
jgi:hypothetical protein